MSAYNFLLFLAFVFHAPSLFAQRMPQITELTLEEKVGQMFFFGFKGTKMSPRTRRMITQLKPGSLIVFGRNIESIEQLSKLTTDLQKLSLKETKIPLFLGADQEGGDVIRIKTTPPMPSAYTIGNTNNPDLARRAGVVTGQMLTTMGLNMNLAPVLDVTDKGLKSFISSRSFSPSPRKTGSMGIAFAEGLSQSSVLPVAKHFPGHGPIQMDSHHSIPSRRSRITDLMGMDLIPFVQFADSGLSSGTMVAHISFPEIDPSGTPATYSKVLINDVLRDQLGYEGLIMTDDIEMAGAAIVSDVGQRAVSAVKSGHDMIMVGWNPKWQRQAVRSVIQAVKKGEISESRINKSVSRILSLKSNYTKKRTIASNKEIRKKFLSIDYKPVFDEIISSYFTTVSPLKDWRSHYKRIYVISHSTQFLKSFKKKRGNLPAKLRYSLPQRKKLGTKDLYVFHVSSYSSYKKLRSMNHEMRKHTLVINTHKKIRISQKTDYLGTIDIHSNHPEVGAFTAKAIIKYSDLMSQRDDNYALFSL